MTEMENIQSLYRQTMDELCSGGWSRFLKTAAWGFKYPFHDQILIYAQRPDMTACATIETWNKLHRTVKPNAAHIALLDDRGDRLGLQYVVDVSDTEGTVPAPIWQMTERKEDTVRHALADAFLDDPFASDYNSSRFFIELAQKLVDGQFSEAAVSLREVLPDSDSMRGMTADAAEVALRQLLIPSVAATIMYRCGLKPQFIMDNTFANMEHFRDPRALSILGQAAQAASRDALLVAAKAVKQWDKTHKEELKHENELSQGRGLSDPGTDRRGNEGSEPVRTTSEDVSERPSAEQVYGNDPDRGTAGAPVSDWGRDGETGERSGRGNAEDRSGTGESSEQRTVDAAHDEAERQGRGTDPSGNRVHLEDGLAEVLEHASDLGIEVSFPSVEEQEKTIEAQKSRRGIPQEELDAVLRSDLNGKISLQTLFEAFKDTPGSEQAASFVKEAYHGAEGEVLFPSGRTAKVFDDTTGLTISSGEQHLFLPWPEVAERIRSLVEAGRYLPEVPKEELEISPLELAEGNTIVLQGTRYQILAVSEETVVLQDCKYPIFTNNMPRSVLETLLENQRGLVRESSESAESKPESEKSVKEEPEPVIHSEADINEGLKEEKESKDFGRTYSEKKLLDDAKANYRFLAGLAPEVLDGKLDYMRFEADGFNPLRVQRIKEDRIAIAQTYEKKGETFLDPEFVFVVLEETKQLYPFSYQQTDPPAYQEVDLNKDIPETGLETEMEIDTFFHNWSQNLEWQEYKPVFGKKHLDSGEIEYRIDEGRNLVLPEPEETPGQEPEEALIDLNVEDYIDIILTRGTGVENGKIRIYEQFQKGESAKENADVLKNLYGWGGCLPAVPNTHINEMHDGKGIHISNTVMNPTSEVHLSWSEVEKRIGDLIREDRYLTEKEKEYYQNRLMAEETPKTLDVEETFTEFTEVDDSFPGSEDISVDGKLPKSYLRDIITTDQLVYRSWDETREFFQEESDPAQRINFLKERYGFGENSAYISIYAHDKRYLGFKAEKDHILLWQDNFLSTNIRQNMSWEEVLELTEQSLDFVHSEKKKEDPQPTLFDFMYLDEEENKTSEPSNIPSESSKPSETTAKPAAEISEDSSADVSTEVKSKLTIWEEYDQIKKDNPEAIVLYQVGDFFEVMGNDAYTVAREFELHTTSRTINENVRVPMCGMPMHQLETRMEMLNARGFDVVLATMESNERQIALVVSQNKEKPTPAWPVGRIEYLGPNGDINLSIEYSSESLFIRDIKSEHEKGQSMAIFLYRNKEGNTISREDIEQLSPVPTIHVIDSPYLPERKEEQTQEQAVEKTEELPTVVQAALSTPVESRINFKIKDMEPDYGGPKKRFQSNLEAIRLLKQIESENRLANEEEQEILSHYVGWGGLQEAFDEDNTSWSKEYEELKGLLTEDEYKDARESTLTAFYTPPAVTEAIFDVLDNLGFRRGNILDPCCATGNFFGMLPESMNESKLYGVELDSISGRIGRQLYQNANILIDGYENTNLPDSFYDIAVGNVPFGSFKLHDRRYDKENFLIHDYFFAKTLDKVRPGGVIAFITSKGTMDKANDSVRKYIAQRADLLGAIRLPNNTFKGNAGTEAVADILFLQKRSRPSVQEASWVGLEEVYNEEKDLRYPINSYFADHPEMVLGDLVEVSGPHGPEITCAAREGESLRDALQAAIQNIQGELELSMDELEEEESRESIPADPNVRNFSYTVVEGDVYFRQDSEMFKVDLNQTAEKRVKGLIEIRDITRNLINAQLEGATDAEIADLQMKLNDTYDRYTEKFGIINSRGNSIAFSDDSSYYLLCSLENINDKGEFLGKADMFYKRTIGFHKAADHVDSAHEALMVCVGERGEIDFNYMKELCDLSKEELISELKGIIFAVPGQDGEYELSSTYLSGNVREKLKIAKEAAEEDPQFAVNVEYLEKAMPEPLQASEISARLGSTWIPDTDVTAFIQELLDIPYYYRENITVMYEPVTDNWTIKNKSYDRFNVRATTTYGTKRADAYRLIEDALNQKDTKIYDSVDGPDGKPRRVLNPTETIEAGSKQDQIKEKFKEWIWEDKERRERLCELYNERFNSIVPPSYDGDMVTFHNMNPLIQLEKHQKEAVARILYGGNTLLAHVVGAGKTFTMAAAAMEAKHLGLSQKSLMVVPNHLVGQWASEIYKLYPSANVLASTKKDFETKNRKKFCSRIATGDYDIIVIGQSQFERIPLSQERQEKTLQDQIEDITWSIQMLDDNAEGFTIKKMEAMKKRLQVKLEKLQDGKKRDDVVTFEELDIDKLFVDESHGYKNLFLYTKMNNVAGISQSDSQKASDMFMKCRYMDEKTGNMGNIHATGTPLSNTMAELYTTQRYLQYDLLQRMNLGSFDAWASTFGETVRSLELAPEGTGYRERTRFAKFFNIPELMNMYKQVADIRTADMLNLPVPTVEYHVDTIEASEEQKEGVQQLAERAEKIRKGGVDSSKDNMLCITNDGRKLALDQRLVDPSLPDNANSKANICADNILKYYKEGEADKLTQLVFCDLSTPTTKRPLETKQNEDGSFEYDSEGFTNVYDDLKQKLVERGIPENEIRFIHEANSDVQKENLFNQVRSGEVRVLIGSTEKMGTGTNVQDRLIAGHDLDCPWRPSDLEQRAGRVIRRGNRNELVHMHRYVTKGTFDAYMYQLIEAKQRFASQIMTSKSPVRVADDIDESVLNYSQIKALASDNPLIREKIELDIDIARLNTLKGRYKDEQYRLESMINALPKEIEKQEERLALLEQDAAFIESQPKRNADGEMHIAVIRNKTYDSQQKTGDALLEVLKKLPRDNKWYKLGELRGFNIIGSKDDFYNTPKLALSKNRSYQIEFGSSGLGLMTRLNNTLDKTVSDNVKECQEIIEKKSRQLASAKVEFGKPFVQEEELRAKLERLKELEEELNMDNKDLADSLSLPEAENPEVEEDLPPSFEVSKKSLDSLISNAQSRSESQPFDPAYSYQQNMNHR